MIVTVWDPDTNGEPGVSDLLAYQAVVLGNDILWNNMDKIIVGDNLADYIDAGGKVIEGCYVQSFDAWGFAGRYMTDGYSPFTPATLDYWNPDTMNIIDAGHPMKVFVQLEGDCNGVYVANKTSTGFDVVELQLGGSNVPFSYRVVCKRKHYEDDRLAAPEEGVQTTKRMMEAVWPETIALREAERAEPEPE